MDSTTSSRPRFLVDASVAVKWHLSDEDDSFAAGAVRIDDTEGRIALLAPEHIRFEVPSAIRNAVRTRRLTSEEGATAIAAFVAWRIPTVADDDLTLAGYDQAIRFGCSLYGGVYLALAESAGCPLVYADNRLRHVLGGRFPLGVWIGDYLFLG